MSSRPRLAAITSGTLLLMAGCPSRPATAVSDLELHRRAIVIDTHSDCTQRIAYDGIDFGTAQPDMQVDLPKMRAGGLDAQFFSIFVGPWRTGPEGYYAEALKQFDAVHAMIRANPDTIAWARTAADVRANAERKRISALFGVEGGHALLPGGETEMLEHLRTFHARGARYLTLTRSIASSLGGSSGDDSDGRGLTDVVRRIIDEMERLGMMIDVSHVSDPLFWDVIRYARKPVIASHSSARELANVPRNMSDAMLRAVARNGGAVCVNYGSAFLDQDFYAREQAVWGRVRGLGLPPRELWRTVREETAPLPPAPPLANPLGPPIAGVRRGVGAPVAPRRAIDASDAALFGATSGRSAAALFYLRWGKATYANVRPARWLPGYRSPLARPEGIDLVIVRENLEDLYVGVEGELAALRPLALSSPMMRRPVADLGPGRFALKVITEEGSARVVRFAFELARRRKATGRPGKLTCATKHNMLPATDGLFREVATRLAASYPDVRFETFIVDDFARRLVAEPQALDVVVLPNLYGDILSDAAAGVIGGLGLAPSGCYGDGYAYFEPAHRSAPDIAGKGIINPTATILSAGMMLDHLGFAPAARRLEAPVEDVYADAPPANPPQGGT